MQSSIEGSGVCNWAAWWWAMGWVYQAMSSEGWNGNSYLSCGYISLFLIHYLKYLFLIKYWRVYIAQVGMLLEHTVGNMDPLYIVKLVPDGLEIPR